MCWDTTACESRLIPHPPPRAEAQVSFIPSVLSVHLIVQQSLTSVLPATEQENLLISPECTCAVQGVCPRGGKQWLQRHSGRNWEKLSWVLRTLRGKAEGEGEESGRFCFLFLFPSPTRYPCSENEYFLILSFESGTGPSTCLIFFFQAFPAGIPVGTLIPTSRWRKQAQKGQRPCSS